MPLVCQREWLDLLEPPIENLIRTANSQIRATKTKMQLPNSKGILLVANDGNFLYTDPTEYMTLVARVIKKRFPNGDLRFPHIQAVIYFSYRIPSKQEGLPFWLPGFLDIKDEQICSFEEKLRSEWFSHISGLLNAASQLSQNISIEVKVKEDGGQIVESSYFCKRCGRSQQIGLYYDSPDTAQNIVCPIHGLIGSFSTYAAFRDTTRLLVNRILAAKGHDLLSHQAKCIHAEKMIGPDSLDED